MSEKSRRHSKVSLAGQESSYSRRDRSGNSNLDDVDGLRDLVDGRRHNSSSSKSQRSYNSQGAHTNYPSANSNYGAANKLLSNGKMNEHDEIKDSNENQGNDEEYDYSDDYDEDFEDDFESETEGSLDDTYNDDEDDSHYDDYTVTHNTHSSHAEKRQSIEMQKVKQSIMEENKQKGSRKDQHGTSIRDNDQRNKKVSFDASNKGFINFSSAKQRQSSKLLAGKTRQRGDELLTMIRLGTYTIYIYIYIYIYI